MAALITEPATTLPGTADWQLLLSKTAKISRGLGLMIAKLTNMGNTSEPQVAQGSRFEVNGSTYECAADESITGWSGVAVGKSIYVYAVPGTGSCSFAFSETVPTFNVPLGGWYNGVNRAMFRLYKGSASLYQYKQVIDLIDTIPVVTADPDYHVVGQIWMRIDL